MYNCVYSQDTATWMCFSDKILSYTLCKPLVIHPTSPILSDGLPLSCLHTVCNWQSKYTIHPAQNTLQNNLNSHISVLVYTPRCALSFVKILTGCLWVRHCMVLHFNLHLYFTCSQLQIHPTIYISPHS